MHSHNDSISIFTDGSKTDDGVGYAVITLQSPIIKRLPYNFSIFSTELLAVLSAIIYIFNSPSGNKFTIYTDCQSILSVLRSTFSDHPIVSQIHDWLVLVTNRHKTVQFCWVPAHVGVHGNELADVAAKAATRLAHVSPVNIPLSDVKSQIGKFSREQWQRHWSSLASNLKLKSIRPSVSPWSHFRGDRRSNTILTRLRIGHTHLTHRYLMTSGAERQAPLCFTCQVILTVQHILVDCPRFSIERRANHLCNLPLSEILRDGDFVTNVLAFLKSINLFYDI